MLVHLVVALASLSIGVGIGTRWGRALEQKAVSQTLIRFARIDQTAREAVSRLEIHLPFLREHRRANAG